MEYVERGERGPYGFLLDVALRREDDPIGHLSDQGDIFAANVYPICRKNAENRVALRWYGTARVMADL